MKSLVKYYSIQSDHLLAIPEYSHKEVVEHATPEKLRKYIEAQKDEYGGYYRKATAERKKRFGFDYTSGSGAVKVEKYKPQKVKKI
jgi:hypothetical protein